VVLRSKDCGTPGGVLRCTLYTIKGNKDVASCFVCRYGICALMRAYVHLCALDVRAAIILLATAGSTTAQLGVQNCRCAAGCHFAMPVLPPFL
jgi:hypothetical protein